MKKGNLSKWIIITIVTVLASNLVQFFITNRLHVEKTADTIFPIYQNKYNIYTHYSSRIQNVSIYLYQLENNTLTPDEGYLFTDGFLNGVNSDYYTYLETLIEKMDSKDNNYELSHIIQMNNYLIKMISELRSNYFGAHQQDSELPESWEQIKVWLKKINAHLSSGSSKDMTLYNITSYPDDFITNSDYTTTMSSLYEEISNVIDIINTKTAGGN